jgi:hypothetical protein
MYLKNDRSVGNGAYVWKVTTLRVMVASKQNVFDHMAAPVLIIMDSHGNVIMIE